MTTEPLLGLTNITGASNFTTTVDPNPWSGPMGPQQYFEVFYLSIVVVLGCFGNLTVIFSIVVENRVHAHGNAFVINLAVADLLVTGFVMPTVIANVVAGGNALPDVACKVAGYTVTVTCTCSVANLMLIAINRYWAVVHSKTYARNFTKKRVYMMVIGCWTWCNLVAMPTLLGWGSIDYDMKMMVCSWNDMISISYTIFLAVCAIFVPLVVIAFCYWKLFSTVRSSGRWVRSLSSGSGILQNSEQNRRSERKERNLLQTLATTVAVFCVCWLPYATTCIVDPRGIPAPAKKVLSFAF
uniref:5-hydroxytryptamine receptor-like n=1 Tax=Phallusia mammillata TaxID=59560 RepID=A0A6F9DEV0_9ASCI|nr:5-hydroxytryptamine receptor-like [Phallusia mammillata]